MRRENIKTPLQKFEEKYPSKQVTENTFKAVEAIGYLQALRDFGYITQQEFDNKCTLLLLCAISSFK